MGERARDSQIEPTRDSDLVTPQPDQAHPPVSEQLKPDDAADDSPPVHVEVQQEDAPDVSVDVPTAPAEPSDD